MNEGCSSHRKAYMRPLRTVMKFMNISIDSLNKKVHYIRLKKALSFVILYFCMKEVRFHFPPSI